MVKCIHHVYQNRVVVRDIHNKGFLPFARRRKKQPSDNENEGRLETASLIMVLGNAIGELTDLRLLSPRDSSRTQVLLSVSTMTLNLAFCMPFMWMASDRLQLSPDSAYHGDSNTIGALRFISWDQSTKCPNHHHNNKKS